MRLFPSPRLVMIRRGPHDLLKFILLLCILAMANQIMHTIPHLQSVLDQAAACCNGDVPAIFHTSSANTFEGEKSCWIHKPIQINASHVVVKESVLEQPSKMCGRLGRDWSRVDLKSPLARQMHAHLSNCSLPIMTFHLDNSFGMGSHFALWSQALCNAWEAGYRLRIYNPDWLWLDKSYCDRSDAERSPFLCYFPAFDNHCTVDKETIPNVNVSDPRKNNLRCSWVGNEDLLANFRAASMEYLFRRVSPLVIQEAQRQIGLLFGQEVPKDIITVHIRWGDKFWEMDLPPIDEYIAAVYQILHSQGRDNSTTAHVYLATEDPQAVKAFHRAAPPNWKVYVDRTVQELDTFRPKKGNRASWTSRNTKGRAGLVALGSLLVALEANSFVLTTKSNWSRLMNELRKNVIDPRCGNCTWVIDLRPGTW